MNRLRAAAAAATVTTLAAITSAGPALAADPTAEGADLIAVSVESGELTMRFRTDGQTPADPRTLRFTASGTPAGVVPDDPGFAFLGRPGVPVWSLQQDSPFSTFDTTGVPRGDVTLDLVSVDGPGSFAAYTLSEWGRPRLLLDSDGPKSTTLPGRQRIGGVVWMFDAAGEYRVTLRASARDGSTTVSDQAVYSVAVPAAAVAPPAAPQAAAPPGAAAPAAESAPRENAAAPAAKAAADAAAPKVIADGHVDMGPNLSGDRMTIRLKDDATTPPTWRELSDVVLEVTGKAEIKVPADSRYAFLGTAGDQVFVLPQKQESGIVWPGWNTQHESVVSGTKGNVTWKLTKVDGPGGFKLFLTDSFGGPEVLFDSAKKLPQQISIPPNTHAHGSWAFTKAGRYRLTVAMTATTKAGKSVTDSKVLTLAVGDSTGTGGTTPPAGGGSTTNPTTGGGDSNGTGDGKSGGGDLAKTGMNIVAFVGGGALLVVGGVVVMRLTRRRDEAPAE
ncbi:TIGR03773 family transporter-associated surface protein [Actinoplanes sp. G11-F43]|uniref:TIGR03773 family transporter-associated surface protein n=1 Tax=Actinoplanes sp. G11-F43 TaxID=3424130 RepID=UPI003D356FD4